MTEETCVLLSFFYFGCVCRLSIRASKRNGKIIMTLFPFFAKY